MGVQDFFFRQCKGRHDQRGPGRYPCCIVSSSLLAGLCRWHSRPRYLSRFQSGPVEHCPSPCLQCPMGRNNTHTHTHTKRACQGNPGTKETMAEKRKKKEKLN